MISLISNSVYYAELLRVIFDGNGHSNSVLFIISFCSPMSFYELLICVSDCCEPNTNIIFSNIKAIVATFGDVIVIISAKIIYL